MKRTLLIASVMTFILMLATSITAFADDVQYMETQPLDGEGYLSQYYEGTFESDGDSIKEGSKQFHTAVEKDYNDGKKWLTFINPADESKWAYKSNLKVLFMAWDTYKEVYTVPYVEIYKGEKLVKSLQAIKTVPRGDEFLNCDWSVPLTDDQSGAQLTTGLYSIYVAAMPCDVNGNIYDNWLDYEPPMIKRDFYITPSGKVTIKNTIANSAKRTNDVIWDKSKVTAATNYQISWRAKGGSWAYKNVGNTVRGTTSGLKVGQMYEIRVRPYGANNSKCYGAWSDTVYRYFHTTEKIRLRSSSKGSFTISWKNNPNATSYQVMFTTNKNGSGAAKNINTIKKGQTSFTKKGLRSGVTYYVQIREVRNYAGKNWIGNISVPVAVKVR